MPSLSRLLCLFVFLGMSHAAIAQDSTIAAPDTAQTSAQDTTMIAQDAGTSEVPRNVVFILSDDHRYDFMGFMDEAPPFLETPNMDRMAIEGAHLAKAFVSTALCSPSRASILTGQYAHRHGIVDNQHLVPEGTRFFPQGLQEAGYQTGFFGKWHMGSSTDEPRPGFDRWVSFRGQGTYYDPTLNIDGERQEFEGYTADILTDYALEWMGEASAEDEPFFLYLSHKSVHAEFMPAERHLDQYADEPPAYPETMGTDVEGRDEWPDWVREQRSSWHGVDWMYHGQMDFDTFYRRYNETLLGLDDSIGRVLDYLEENGLAENTLVVYMGDNGFSFGEHGLIDKRHAYEESMRVPMLAWAPGFIEEGTTIDQMVMNVDVAPTFLGLAGASMPDDHTLDGMSFLPLLQGQDVEDWRDEVFYEYYWEWTFPQTPTQFALRTDRHKYIFYYGLWEPGALYDLENDPQERNNLVEEQPELANELRNRLFDTLEATDGMSIPLRRPTGGQQAERRPEDEASMSPVN